MTSLSSNFPLQSGYSVELQTLSAHSTAASVTNAEIADATGRRARGADSAARLPGDSGASHRRLRDLLRCL